LQASEEIRVPHPMQALPVMLMIIALTVSTGSSAAGPAAQTGEPVADQSLSMDEPSPGIGAFLDRQGRLDLPPGFTGSLDPSGFRMTTTETGAPRFVPTATRGTTLPADARWSDELWLGSGCNDRIEAVATGPGGELYLGGEFTRCGGVDANYFIRFVPATQAWEPVGSGNGNGFNDYVRTIEVYGSDIYVGGMFTEANAGDPVSANRIALWNGSEWSALGSGDGNGVGTAGGAGTVMAIELIGSDLYAGGFFEAANLGDDVPANNIARWDGSEWFALGTASANGVNNGVRALASIGNDLYVGGTFSSANAFSPSAVTVNYVARWDGNNWSPLGNGVGEWSGSGTGGAPWVHTLAASGTDLYVGGGFTEVNPGTMDQMPVNRLARWDGTAWSIVGDNDGNGVSGAVQSMVFIGNDLYVGGHFTQAYPGVIFPNQNVVSAMRVARWDGAQWHALESGSGNGLGAFVHALATNGSELFVGGWFSEANVGDPQPANNIVAWTGSSWTALEYGALDTIRAVVVDGDDVYIGGDFTSIGTAVEPLAANRVAHWNGETWSALGSSGGNGVNGPVSALALGNDALYVGGEFTVANLGGPSASGHGRGGGIDANRIARWNGSTWSSVGAGGGNGANGAVHALAVDGDDIYVGGDFNAVNVGNQVTANNIALWDGSNWVVVGSNSGNGVNGPVAALAIGGDNLFVGGGFTVANLGGFSPVGQERGGSGTPANRIARWNGSSWSALGSAGGNGVNGAVNALAAAGDDVYVGGAFTAVNVGNPVTANHIARFDGSGWTSLGSGSGNGVNGEVHSLATDGDVVYAGGDFTQANVGQALAAGHVARFDDNAWTSMGSGTNGPVQAMAIPAIDALVTAGSFSVAGGQAAGNLARYRTRGDLDVVLAGIGTGTVESTPVGIDCPGTCDALMAWDRLTTLTAMSDPGWLFVGWSGGGCSGTGPCQIMMEEDVTITAHFSNEDIFADRFEEQP
jgi:trimeric autotransporter adhesin